MQREGGARRGCSADAFQVLSRLPASPAARSAAQLSGLAVADAALGTGLIEWRGGRSP